MKKLSVFILAILFIIGLGTATNAALTFDVDFWTTPGDRLGPGDLGGTFDVFVGEEINVDIYFSTDEEFVAGSWNLLFSPAGLVSVQDTIGAPATDGWALPTFEASTGSVKYQDIIFPPGDTITGDDILFGTILFQCEGEGPVDLILTNYLGFLTATDAVDFEDINLGTINQIVPIPGAVWLMGSGLLGLLAFRRRKKT